LSRHWTPCRPPSEPLTFWWTTLQKHKRESYNSEFYRLFHYWMPEEEQPPFPPGTTLPITLGKDNTRLVYQPCDIHVCIYQERLRYVISIPSAHKRTFIFVRMMLILVPMDHENFLHRDVDNFILCLHCVYIEPGKICLSLSDSPAI